MPNIQDLQAQYDVLDTEIQTRIEARDTSRELIDLIAQRRYIRLQIEGFENVTLEQCRTFCFGWSKYGQEILAQLPTLIEKFEAVEQQA